MFNWISFTKFVILEKFGYLRYIQKMFIEKEIYEEKNRQIEKQIERQIVPNEFAQAFQKADASIEKLTEAFARFAKIFKDECSTEDNMNHKYVAGNLHHLYKVVRVKRLTRKYVYRQYKSRWWSGITI